MKKTTNYYFWLGSILVFLIDLSTKIWALNFLPEDEEFLINKLISFHRIYNESTIALDYTIPFADTTTQFRVFWLLFAFIITISIYFVIKQKVIQQQSIETEFAKTGLFILLGSIWGNAFDRIFRPAGVVDFIRLNLVDSIPILNFADIMVYLANFCFICSWIIILVKLIKFKKYNNTEITTSHF